MSAFVVRFFDSPDNNQGSIFSPFAEVAISDDGECIEADGKTLARQSDGEWVPYPRPWEKWSEVSIEPYQADDE